MPKSIKRAHQETAFLKWYEVDRDTAALSKILQPVWDEKGWGEAPGYDALHRWRSRFGWDEKADKLDDEVAQRETRQAIKRKTDMLKRHAQNGRALQTQALNFMNDRLKNRQPVIETVGQAMRAIETGTRMERQAEGLPDWIIEYMGLSDEQLLARYASILTQIARGSDGDETPGVNPTIIEEDFTTPNRGAQTPPESAEDL